MRINRNSFAVALALTTVLTASSALAAARTPNSPDTGDRSPNVIVRIIESIKKHVVHALDGVISNPPQDLPH